MAPAPSIADTAPPCTPYPKEAISFKERKINVAELKEITISRTSIFQDTMFEMEAMLNEHTERPDDAYLDVVECLKSAEIEKINGEDCSRSVEIQKVKEEDCSKSVVIKKFKEDDCYISAEINRSKEAECLKSVEITELKEEDCSKPVQIRKLKEADGSKPVEMRKLKEANCLEPVEMRKSKEANCSKPMEMKTLKEVDCSKPVEMRKLKQADCSKPVELRKLKETDCSKPVGMKKLKEVDGSKPMETKKLKEEECSKPTKMKKFKEADCSKPVEMKKLKEVVCSKPVEMKKLKETDCSEHVEMEKFKEVDCSKPMETKKIKEEDENATENSSSFDGTISGPENYNCISEAEVESQISGNHHRQYAFDSFNSLLPTRKKKVTSEWRSFIRPLMWRCKWTELRMREIESQALKYEGEITEIDHSKQYQHRLEDYCSKALALCNQTQRRKLMKRRRRRRVEDIANTALYMSSHNLFSYFENADGASTPDDFWNPVVSQRKEDRSNKYGMNSDPSFFEFEEGEISFEQILWCIEDVNNRVRKINTELKALISSNPERLSWDNLLLPLSSPTSSHCDMDVGDHLLNVPDIIESTAGLLCSTDDALQIMDDSCDDMADNVLIHNQGGEEYSATAISSERCMEEPSHRLCIASELRFPKRRRAPRRRRPGFGAWSRMLLTDLGDKS